MAIAPATSFGLSFWLGGDSAPKLGLGLVLEPGIIFRDRGALTLHLMGTIFPASALPFGQNGFVMTGGGLSYDWFLNDRWSIGAGNHVLAYFGGLNVVSLMFPARVTWRSETRAAQARARSSFMVGAQLGAGFSLLGLGLPSYAFNMTFNALITVGYGWW